MALPERGGPGPSQRLSGRTATLTAQARSEQASGAAEGPPG